ncbi:MAG: hypothetical protein ACRDQZ_18855 [Mycobacteriales bacterium]
MPGTVTVAADALCEPLGEPSAAATSDGRDGAGAGEPAPAWAAARSTLAASDAPAADPGGRWGTASSAADGPGRVWMAVDGRRRSVFVFNGANV